MKMNEKAALKFIELYHREHDLLNTRTNIFLLAQMILLGAFTLALSNTANLPIMISAIGIFYSLLWLIITSKGYHSYLEIKQLLSEYENNLPEDEKTYAKISPWIRGEKKIPMVTFILAWIFPLSWIIFWIISIFF